jgi:NAD(P)-dependent dehydrogenase (short-subunit alcohol dehydrogenase family)
MAGRLDGKVAVITGGGAGLGRGIARVFGSEGAAIVIAGRTIDKCEAVAAEIEASGGRAVAVACDVNDRAQVDAAVKAATTTFGTPSILVNNAFGGPIDQDGPIEDLTDERCEAAWRGAYLASLYGMQAVFPGMKELGGGSIVNVASPLGIAGAAGSGAYGSAKEAVRALTRHAASEWGQHGIRVNAIAPLGFNQKSEHLQGNLPDGMKAFAAKVPLRRMGDAREDIGQGVLALVTDLHYVTGATLSLDGGFVLH